MALIVAAAWGYLLVVRPLLNTAVGEEGVHTPDLDYAVMAVEAEMTDGGGSADYTFTARENSDEVEVTPGAHKSIIVETNGYDARWLVFYNASSDYTVLCLNESAEALTPGCELYIVSEKPPSGKSAPTGGLTDEEKREVWDAAAEYQRSIKYNDPNRLQKLKETEKVIAERFRLREEDVKSVLAEGRRENWPKPERKSID
jgi:hypothetical protein